MPPKKNVVEERPPLIGRLGTNLKVRNSYCYQSCKPFLGSIGFGINTRNSVYLDGYSGSAQRW